MGCMHDGEEDIVQNAMQMPRLVCILQVFLMQMQRTRSEVLQFHQVHAKAQGLSESVLR